MSPINFLHFEVILFEISWTLNINTFLTQSILNITHYFTKSIYYKLEWVWSTLNKFNFKYLF